MYICICNPFTDTDVQNHLTSLGQQKARISDTYRACSGEDKMNCGSCACTLKSMVDTHNQTLTIYALSESMEKATSAPVKLKEKV